MNDDDVLNTVLLKGILTVVILAFARKAETVGGHLQPYRPNEAMDIVNDIFTRAKKDVEN